jgi:hypothetical protein
VQTTRNSIVGTVPPGGFHKNQNASQGPQFDPGLERVLRFHLSTHGLGVISALFFLAEQAGFHLTLYDRHTL